MDYHEFVGEVQHRLELPWMGEAVRAIRAVLTTLVARIHEGEASDLAGALSMEIDYYLLDAESGQRFGFDEFVSRVAERAELGDDEEGRPEAAYYAQAVGALLAAVVPGAEFEEAREGFPADEGYDELFELVGVEEAFDGGIEQDDCGTRPGHRHSRSLASRLLPSDRSRSTAHPRRERPAVRRRPCSTHATSGLGRAKPRRTSEISASRPAGAAPQRRAAPGTGCGS